MEFNRKRPVCPRDGPGFSRGRVPFVPGTVPVCPEHRPLKKFMFIGFSCPRLPTNAIILRRKFPLPRGAKATNVPNSDNCRRLCTNCRGLKPPFESPHLDFPELSEATAIAEQSLDWRCTQNRTLLVLLHPNSQQRRKRCSNPAHHMLPNELGMPPWTWELGPNLHSPRRACCLR